MAEKTATPSTNDERAQRRARRQALIDAGVQPYPIHSTVTAHAADLEERYADLPDGTDTEDVYSLTGRIRAFRKQGKARLHRARGLHRADPALLSRERPARGRVGAPGPA